MASLDSSIRSAARATYSAYKRQPIRWRLAGGSAALTLVILLGFAVIVGTLTTRAISKDFNRQVASAADRLQSRQFYKFETTNNKGQPQYRSAVDLNAYAASNNAAIRVVTANGTRFDGVRQRAELRAAALARAPVINGWKVETREIQVYSDYDHPQFDLRVCGAVRPPHLRHPRDREPRAAVPRPRRARRRGARPARRPGDRPARDGADRGAHRRGARDRAHARHEPEDPAPAGRRRGRGALDHAWNRCCTSSTTPARRPRRRSRGSASSSPTPATS